MADWIADELSEGYQQRTIPLGDDPDGEGVRHDVLISHEGARKTAYETVDTWL